MEFLTLPLQMLSGVVGGHLLANQLKSSNLGSAGNTLAGLIGGGIGSQILSSLLGLGTNMMSATDAGSPDLANIIGMILTGGAGGGLLTVIMGWLTRAVAR